jgi:hypothetical protein
MNIFAEKNPEFFGPFFDVVTQAAVDYFAVKEMPKRTQDWQLVKDFMKGLQKVFKGRFYLFKFMWKSLKGAISFI